MRSVFYGTKGASSDGRILPGTRSGFFFFLFLLLIFPRKPIRVKICARAWDPDYRHIARIVNVEIYECVNFIFLFPRRGDLDRELRHTATGAANTQPKPWLKISLILRLFFFFCTHRAILARADDAILSKGSSINSERK